MTTNNKEIGWVKKIKFIEKLHILPKSYIAQLIKEGWKAD